MTWTLVRKLLRDLRWPLLITGLLLGAFQALWAKITHRTLSELAPFFNQLAEIGGFSPQDIEDQLFSGPGKIIRTLIGGENINLDTAMDILSIGYVHPLMQTIFCIWAVGRAAGAIAGELDRGTMELLLSQPIARTQLVFAHLCVDLLTIPVLCLCLWGGTSLGTWLTGPIREEAPPKPVKQTTYLIELGPLKVKVDGPANLARMTRPDATGPAAEERLAIHLPPFGRGLWVIGGLMFAVCGQTMWISAAGRFRNRVLGLAILLLLLQFLVNLLGQMWDVIAPLRPFTIFYYFQPQLAILGKDWSVYLREWNAGQPLVPVPMLAVLYGVGLLGYLMAWWTFCKRDLPAPL